MRHMLGKALLICALPLGAAAAGPHDPLATYMVEAIPFALKDGKSMDDMMALRDDFAKLAEAGDLVYSAYVMSPHFMSQSSLPVDEKFDAVWLGFSRNPSTLAASLSAYLESGAEMEQAFVSIGKNHDLQKSFLKALHPEDNQPRALAIFLSVASEHPEKIEK